MLDLNAETTRNCKHEPAKRMIAPFFSLLAYSLGASHGKNFFCTKCGSVISPPHIFRSDRYTAFCHIIASTITLILLIIMRSLNWSPINTRGGIAFTGTILGIFCSSVFVLLIDIVILVRKPWVLTPASPTSFELLEEEQVTIPNYAIREKLSSLVRGAFVTSGAFFAMHYISPILFVCSFVIAYQAHKTKKRLRFAFSILFFIGAMLLVVIRYNSILSGICGLLLAIWMFYVDYTQK